MPVYAKKLNGKQRAALKQFETVTGFEPLYQDDLDAGKMTFYDLWRANIKWLEGVLADATNINIRGC